MGLRSKQHKLLKVLHEPCINFTKTLEGRPALSFEEIYNKTGFDYNELSIIAARLYTDKEVHPYDVGGIKGLCLITDGITAYSEKKYIKERNAHIISRLKDYLGITTAIIAICTTIFTAWYTSTSVNKNESQIEKLESKVSKLELQNTTGNLFKIKHDSLSMKQP